MTTRQLFSLIALVGLAACRTNTAPAEREKGAATSETPPKFGELQRPASVLKNSYSPSQGDCAPKYKSGLVGTCIDGQACRGFGTLDDAGKPACSCFGKAGGCGVGFRCDVKKKRCVPETEPPDTLVPAR
jgi:hypothetical protein